MAGSGKYVAIAASNTLFDDSKIAGVVFGVKTSQANTPHCQVRSRYVENNSGVVTGTAFCIDQGIISSNRSMCLNFQHLTRVDVRNYTAYTGTIRVGYSVTVPQDQHLFDPPTTNYIQYHFENGLFTGSVQS